MGRKMKFFPVYPRKTEDDEKSFEIEMTIYVTHLKQKSQAIDDIFVHHYERDGLVSFNELVHILDALKSDLQTKENIQPIDLLE